MSGTMEDGIDGRTDQPEKLCRRCGAANPPHIIRQDWLCQACFERYISTKVVKRLEAFRGRKINSSSPRRWLLPISLGPSSACLLHVLDAHLQRQIDRSGFASYELCCLHVDFTENSSETLRLLKDLEQRYPRYSYTTVPLMSISELEFDISSLATNGHSENAVSSHEASSSEPKRLSVPSQLSKSSQTDIRNLLLRKTIVKAAQKLQCEGILLGTSTTKLAEKVLAETAKGRGAALTTIVNDHQTPQGVWIYYPMRDVLKKEILQFVDSVALPTQDYPAGETTKANASSTRTSTIDNLMTGYFQSVEENYPSIVANVVRTSSKLQQTSGSSGNGPTFCALCELPLGQSNLDAQPQETTVNSNETTKSSSSPNSPIFCHACDLLTE